MNSLTLTYIPSDISYYVGAILLDQNSTCPGDECPPASGVSLAPSVAILSNPCGTAFTDTFSAFNQTFPCSQEAWSLQDTPGDYAAFAEWLIGGFLLGVFCTTVAIYMLCRPHRLQEVRIAMFRGAAVCTAVVGGALALTTAILRSRSVRVQGVDCAGPDTNGFDCIGALVLSGSSTGFLGACVKNG